MVVELFNWHHLTLFLTTLGIVALVCVIFAVFLRKKSKWISWTAILILLATGFIFHFLRLAWPPPNATWPSSLAYVLPISICGFNTLVFPLIFFSKKKYLRDYMFYVGVFSGFLAMLTPTNVLESQIPAWHFEAIRYYIAHGILVVAPLLMVLCGHHKLNWRRVWAPGWLLVGVTFVILINDVILYATGIYDGGFVELFDRNSRNVGMIYGPADNAGFWGDALRFFSPRFLRRAPFDNGLVAAGETFYWPVLWVVIPGVIYMTIGCFLVSLIFDFRTFKQDMQSTWRKIFRKKSIQKSIDN